MRGHGEGLAQRNRGFNRRRGGNCLGQHLETAWTVESGQRGSLFWTTAWRQCPLGRARFGAGRRRKTTP